MILCIWKISSKYNRFRIIFTALLTSTSTYVRIYSAPTPLAGSHSRSIFLSWFEYSFSFWLVVQPKLKHIVWPTIYPQLGVCVRERTRAIAPLQQQSASFCICARGTDSIFFFFFFTTITVKLRSPPPSPRPLLLSIE